MSVLVDPLPHAFKVVVFGLGWTGVAAANLLRRFGKQVVATDTRDAPSVSAALSALLAREGLRLDPEVEIVTGAHTHGDADAVVLTQSVKHWEAPVVEARAAGVAVVPELDLGSRSLGGGPLEIVAIGGTDGKTTTTKLCAHLAASLGRAWIGGNSWTPLSARLLEIEAELTEQPLREGERALVITEVSAFQLPAWHEFHPRVGAVTNVAEDHVDEYFQGSVEDYIAAKRATVGRLGVGDAAVLNFDDRVVGRWREALLARSVRVIGTSLSARAVADIPDAAFRCNGELRLRWGGREVPLMPSSTPRLVGDHNTENVLTAAAALLPYGLAELDGVADRVATFEPPPHRMEYVKAVGGIDCYDDSKATNVHAALAGLSAFGARPVVAIVGGVDKGLELAPLLEALRTRARLTVVIGEIAPRLMAEAEALGIEVVRAATLEEATERAFEAAVAGDALVLSPACSSFDMFSSYAERGRAFQGCVETLRARPV